MILKNQFKKCGYFYVTLCKNGIKSDYRVHRLVAEAFIPNPLNLPYVNHRDENPLNNFVENLEWCTARYNSNYGTRNDRLSDVRRNNPKESCPVIQYTLDGEYVGEYPSIHEANRQTGIDRRIITRSCKGETKNLKQYIWKYKKEADD